MSNRTEKMRDGPTFIQANKSNQTTPTKFSAASPPKTSKPKQQQPKRLSVSLSADVVEAIEWLSEIHHVSLNEVIRRSLLTEEYIQQQVHQGSRILIERSDGEIREVVFR